MDLKMLPVYFVIGGAVVTLVTYLGSQAKGLLAAFVLFFPSATLVTISTIYLAGGASQAASYARSLITMTPAWLLYIGTVMYLLPRLGLVWPLLIGVSVFVAASLLTMRLAHL